MHRSWMQINVGAVVFLCSHQWNKVHVIIGLLTMHRLPSQPLATLFIDILIERSGKQRGFIWCACCALSVCTCSTWRVVCALWRLCWIRLLISAPSAVPSPQLLPKYLVVTPGHSGEDVRDTFIQLLQRSYGHVLYKVVHLRLLQ